MQFVDEVDVEAVAGRGGDGCVAFRREKFVPLGGPAGGDGGRGGDVILEADSRLSTLFDIRGRRRLAATPGEHGRGKDQYGKSGHSVLQKVPVGTQVFRAADNRLLADLKAPGQQCIAAKGGRGGRGNIHFTTPHDRAPRRAEPGEAGEHAHLRLELKLLADVGLVGHPNVGKSSFIARVSRARPKIADYPFTTLTPNLGVVSLGIDRSFVIADVPGLIPGASDGAGLGHRFLKHLERTRVLLYLLTIDGESGHDPARDFRVLRNELQRFSPDLASRPYLVAITKIDLPQVQQACSEDARLMDFEGQRPHLISNITGEGVNALLLVLEKELLRLGPAAQAQSQRSSLGAPPHEERAGEVS